MIINFLFVLVSCRPVKFQTVLVVAHRKIDLLDRDCFYPGRLPCSLINRVSKFSGLSFFPQAQGEFETTGIGSRISIGPAVIESTEARAFFVNDKDLPLRSVGSGIDALVNAMGLSSRGMYPLRWPSDRVCGSPEPIVSIDLHHFKFLLAVPFCAGPKLNGNVSFFCRGVC